MGMDESGIGSNREMKLVERRLQQQHIARS
jgi:hypothetical protein